jgi:L-ascorbate metabolism protein UlaG (beta-lactamase superfamily)
MRITKIGHSCLVVHTGGINMLIDPGGYFEIPENLPEISAILITHEHQDHLYVPYLKAVMEKNPQAKVYSNESVREILADAGLGCEVIQDGDRTLVGGVSIQAVGHQHAPIHPIIPTVSNIGFIIDDYFFYPGDAFTYPDKHIEVLALPVSGPWIKISEAMDYAVKIGPVASFPVHDGMLKFFGTSHDVPARFLPRYDIKFFRMEETPTIDA